MLQISIFQRTKAIHNRTIKKGASASIVTNIDFSKNKSNSQRNTCTAVSSYNCYKYRFFKERKQFTTWFADTYGHLNCYKYRFFKERKQFTTKDDNATTPIVLLQISIFQRTKAIHNFVCVGLQYIIIVTNIDFSKNESNSQQGQAPGSHLCIVTNIDFSKNESNSQLSCCLSFTTAIVTNIDFSKNESNSQLKWAFVPQCLHCYKYRFFKERKQFTTKSGSNYIWGELLQISIFQRTKAIHNSADDASKLRGIVTNIDFSKNESNSQPLAICVRA